MYIDKEDRDVITMCNENKRRSSLTTVVGYLMPQKEAMEYAVSKAVQKRRGVGRHEFAIFAVSLFISVVILVIKLAG